MRIRINIKQIFTNLSFYLSAIIFVVFSAVYFFIKNQFFTGNGSTDLTMFFTSVPYMCILVIPALCYKNSFYIYENFIPLSRLNKIINNFFCVLIEYIICLLLLIPAIFLINSFGDVDWGQVFTSLFILIFYGAALTSLCIFINELISNNIAGFVVSAILLLIFNSIHLAVVYINLGNFLSAVCRQLSFAWHFDAASKGIFDTRDFVYLFGSSLLFILSAAFIKELKAGNKSKAFIQKMVLFILISLFVILNGNRWYKRFDLSKNQTFSLSKYTKSLCSKIEGNLKITYYRSGSLSKMYPQVRDVADFLNIYAAQNKNISFIIKDTDKDKEAEKMLENYGVQPQQMRTIKNNSTEFVNVYSCITMEYMGITDFIPFVLASQSLEYDLDSRLKYLITDERRIVNILCGNGMSLYEDYSYVIPWLNSQNFICNPLYIDDPLFTQNLELCKGPIIILGDSEINIDNAIAIEDYILSGKGNGFFAVSPYSCDIENDWSISANSKTNVVEILENWGIGFTKNIAADVSCARITMSSESDAADPFTQNNTITQMINYPLWISLLPQDNCNLGMTLFWPVQLELSGNAKPYLITSDFAYLYETKNGSESLIQTNPFILQNENISEKQRKSYVVGAKVEGTLKGLFNLKATDNGKIIAVSDPYFVNSLMTGYIGNDYGDYRNFEFLGNALLKLNGEDELALLQSKSSRDSSLYKVNDIESYIRLIRVTYIVLFILLPMLIVIIGITVLIILKAKRKKLALILIGNKNEY